MKKLKHTSGPFDLQIGPGKCFHDGNRVAITKWDKDGGEVTNTTVAEVWPTEGDIDKADGRLLSIAPTAPHHCADPKCPGDINRRKLELWDVMLVKMKGAVIDLEDWAKSEDEREYDVSCDGLNKLAREIEAIIQKAEAIK